MVICLERGADSLSMVQLISMHPKNPLSLASFISRLILPFWYWLMQVVLEKWPSNRCVCMHRAKIYNATMAKFSFSKAQFEQNVSALLLDVVTMLNWSDRCVAIVLGQCFYAVGWAAGRASGL